MSEHSEHDERDYRAEVEAMQAAAREVLDDEGVEDFDAFWSAQNRTGRKVRLFGEVVTLPPALPLQFEFEARKLQRSKRGRDVSKLVGILYGPDALEKFSRKGLDADQFQLLLAWTPRAISDPTVTLQQVADELAAAEAKGAETEDGEADPT